MGNGIKPGSLGINHSFRDYIDTGTMCKALSPVPGSVGTHSNITVSNGSQTIFGNAYLFILADEILPSGKLVRKVIRVPNYTTASMMASTPELFGLRPNNILNSKVTIGEHALGNTNSRFISTSANKSGAPNIKGRPVYIDIKKALASGVTIHSTDEIIADLDRIAKQQSNHKQRCKPQNIYDSSK